MDYVCMNWACMDFGYMPYGCANWACMDWAYINCGYIDCGCMKFTCMDSVGAQNRNRTCTHEMWTWPSTMRVYQFRHLGKCPAKVINFIQFDHIYDV